MDKVEIFFLRSANLNNLLLQNPNSKKKKKKQHEAKTLWAVYNNSPSGVDA